MRPRLRALSKVSLTGIAEVRISPETLSFSCGRKGRGAINDEPVLMHRFPCPVTCSANTNFQISAVGGDGKHIPQCTHVHPAVNFLFLVICMLMLSTGIAGYDSALDSIVVAHQGNDGPNL